MTVRRRTTEYGNDDLGAERPHHPDHVVEQLLPRPERERFVRPLGVAEVEGPSEVLASPVQAPSGFELSSPDDAESLPELGAYEVLTTFTPREGKVRRFRPEPPRQHGEQAGILVVGMGTDHEDPLHAVHLTEEESGRHQATLFEQLAGESTRSNSGNEQRSGERGDAEGTECHLASMGRVERGRPVGAP